MNLLLLDPSDLIAEGRAVIRDRRLQQAQRVWRSKVGDEVKVGMLGGKLGRAEVLRIDADAIELGFHLDRDPPPASPLVLALALPRPPVLRRVLQQATALGLKHICLFAAARVENSYWSSQALSAADIAEQLRLGLEQGVDTIAPKVELWPRFRPFVEDELPRLVAGRRCWVADPDAGMPCPADPGQSGVLVIGPEGGFVPFERERLATVQPFFLGLGPRVLRVETAVVAAIARLGLLPWPRS